MSMRKGVDTMCNALGIINYDDASAYVEGLQDFRPMPSISFLGRYRLIDFAVSNMTNSGIDRIQVYVKAKPRSVFEHLGTGRQYNINSKRGKLQLLSGEEPIHSEIYNHDVTAFVQNMQYIEEDKHPYVVIAPSFMVTKIDFNEVMAAHVESGADVTVVYQTIDNAKEEFIGMNTLSLDNNKRVIKVEKNQGKFKNRNIALKIYLLRKDLFIDLVKLAQKTSSMYSFNDVLVDNLGTLNIVGYNHKGYVCCINSQQQYFKANMELICREKAKELFDPKWPFHTRTSDSCPTQYSAAADVKFSTISNGCFIEGKIRNSVMGRGVVVKPGAIIENCIILSGAFIGENAHLKYCIVDKDAKILHIKELIGSPEDLIYVKRRDTV
jgi:glucose-1-phosphate adenylyltransferase